MVDFRWGDDCIKCDVLQHLNLDIDLLVVGEDTWWGKRQNSKIP